MAGDLMTDGEVMDAIQETMDELTEGNEEKLLSDVTVKDEAHQPQQEAPAPEKPSTTTEETDIDFSDLPNGKIRYEKLKEQSSEKDSTISDLQLEVARLKGQNEVLDRPETTEEEDPTQYMSDEEKKDHQRDQEVDSLRAEIRDLQKSNIKKSLQEKDNAFYANHPDLEKTRSEHSKQMLAFIRSKPGTAKDVYDGVTSLEQIHLMMGGGKSEVVQDPAEVFGTTKGSPAPARTTSKTKDKVKSANDVLSDPNSMNKKAAVQDIENDIVDELFDML
jgi:hypothetical protein